MDPSLSSDLALLEALIVDNPELERLERLLEQFNIFEALGAVRVELRHSDFLAFLLDPNQNHGLGDVFVKRLLQKVVGSAQVDTPINPISLDVMDLDELVVLREWQNIDILLLDEKSSLAVIIENKVGSSEHSNQLERYRITVRTHHPGMRQLCLYLTPDGEEPTDPTYIPIDYGLVASLVEDLLRSRESVLGPDVLTLMKHYGQMLRRHIVSDSEIVELCQKIYRKHQRALDMIYEYRPDQQAELHDFLEGLIRSEPSLVLEHSGKTNIRFAPGAWKALVLHQGEGWNNSGQMLAFEFRNDSDRLKLSLVIGPGPMETRQKLWMMAQENRLLKPALRALGKKYNTIYVRTWLKLQDYEDASIDELRSKVIELWGRFLEHDLPDINKVVQAEEWIWE